MKAAEAFLGDSDAVAKLVAAVRYHVEEAFFVRPERSAPDALVRDLAVDVVVLTTHFHEDPTSWRASVIRNAKSYVEAVARGAFANLLDAGDDYSSRTLPSQRLSQKREKGQAHAVFRQLRNRLTDDDGLPHLLRDVVMTAGAWRGPLRPTRESVVGKKLSDEMAVGEARRARLAHVSLGAYRTAMAELLSGKVSTAPSSTRLTRDTLTAAATELFSLTTDGASRFIEERLGEHLGSQNARVTIDAVVDACHSALAQIGPNASEAPTQERFLELESAPACRSGPLASFDSALLVAEERRRLFGEPVSLRYNNGMTAMTYLVRMLRLIPDYIRLGLSQDGRVVGFVAALPLKKDGYRHLMQATKGIYAFIDEETIERRPGKAYTILVQNFINRLDGIRSATTNMALGVLERVARDVADASVDRNAGGPRVVATGAHLAGQAVLIARRFRHVGFTPHGTPIFEYAPRRSGSA